MPAFHHSHAMFLGVGAGRHGSLRMSLSLIIGIFALTAGCGSHASDASNDDDHPDPYSLKTMTKIADNGGRGGFSPDGGRIAFDRKEPTTGYYGLWIMNADGSAQRPLMASRPAGFPTRHGGNPAWHPSGDWLLVNAQKQVHPGAGTSIFDAVAEPGIGFNNDLWIVSSDGTEAYRLWENPTPASVLAPQPGLYNARFDHSGTRVAWTHIYNGAEGAWGDFAIRVADFTLEPEPHLVTGSLHEYDPVAACNFKEVHGWSPDDTRLVVSGNWRLQHEYDQDIGLLDLSTGEIDDLTPAPGDVWTEAATIHPAGEKIVYMSSEGYPLQYASASWWTWLKTDYWIMDLDGSDRRRLTYFNAPGHAEYNGDRVNAAAFKFSPDGTKMVGVLSRNAALEIWIFAFGR